MSYNLRKGKTRKTTLAKYKRYLNSRRLALPYFIHSQDLKSFKPRRLDHGLCIYRDLSSKVNTWRSLHRLKDWNVTRYDDSKGRPLMFELGWVDEYLKAKGTTLYDVLDDPALQAYDIEGHYLFCLSPTGNRLVPFISNELLLRIETLVALGV